MRTPPLDPAEPLDADELLDPPLPGPRPGLDTDAPVWPGHGRRRLGDVLVAAAVLTDAELRTALEAQRTVIGSRRRLGHVLVDLGMATERQIAEALGDQLRLEVVDLNKIACRRRASGCCRAASPSGWACSSSPRTGTG